MIALLVASVLASDVVDHHVAQAELFAKKGWTGDALRELDLALASGGESEPEVWWLLAQVKAEAGDFVGAYEAADRAAELGAEQAAAYAAQLKRSWGGLEVTGPREDLVSFLQLEREGVLLDPALKEHVQDTASAWKAKKQELPLTVSLPAGSYLVNGVSVTVVAGDTTTLSLPQSAIGAQGFAALQVARIDLGFGVGMLGSTRVPDLRPGLEVQAGFTQPVAGMLVGVVVDHAFRSWIADGTVQSHPGAWTGGARVGRELMVGGPLAVRPMVGWRYGTIPGVPLSCRRALDGYACTAPKESFADDGTIYAVGTAHIPFAELAVDWRRGGRVNAHGFGVRMVVDHAFGQVPLEGEATVVAGGDGAVGFTVDEGSFSATGFRLLAEVSLGL